MSECSRVAQIKIWRKPMDMRMVREIAKHRPGMCRDKVTLSTVCERPEGIMRSRNLRAIAS